MIDITDGSKDRRAARLSNFAERHFIYREVVCRSIEDILQAQKCPAFSKQKEICLLIGKRA